MKTIIAKALKFCIPFICLLGISFNGWATDGEGFTTENLIRNLVWNQAKGRIEFKVMFYDNCGGNPDEYIRDADLYIGGTRVGQLQTWCHPLGENNEYDYANFYFHSTQSSNNDHLTIHAGGSTTGCKTNSYVSYQEIKTSNGQDKYYTSSVNSVTVTGDEYNVNHAYANFFWYPGELGKVSSNDITIELKNIALHRERSSNAAKPEDQSSYLVTKSDVSKSVTMTGVFTGPLNATLEDCGKVKLSWSVFAPATVTGSDGFNIEVKKGNGDWGKAGSNGTDATVSYTSGTTDYSFTYEIPEADLNKEYVNYEFRVKWKFAGWGDADTRGAYQRNKSISIYTNHVVLTGTNITAGTDGYPRLTWWRSGGIWCDDKVSLELKIGGISTVTLNKDKITAGSYQTTSSTSGLEGCTKQRYELILKYGSLPEVPYTVSEDYVYQPAVKHEFDKIIVSKGYYSDRINVKWTLKDGYTQFDGFRVMRKEATEPDNEYAIVHEVSSSGSSTLQYGYDDYEINAGVYYNYKIEGYKVCDESKSSIPSPVDIGFSQPYGSVSGRVTFTGSQAVQDVQLGVFTESSLLGNREIEFSAGQNMRIPANAKLFSRDGFSFQFWLKPAGSGDETILENSLLKIARAADGKISFTMGGEQVTLPKAIDNDVYSHLTFTAEKSGDYRNYKINVYLNDSLKVEDAAITLSSDAETPVDSTTVGGTFSGVMDDIRIWDRILTLKDIVLNYDRVLGGKEPGLKAYYRCDEIDVAGDNLFDCSADGNTFNGNHAKKSSGTLRINIPATATHLTIKGVTDENGNYIITNSIPYASEGTLYSIVPVFGIHQFDPSNRPLFFSPDSRVFNNIDFTDISSFPVSGQIVYANTDYPVEGVQISIDGLAASRDGEAVTTDAEGKFTVEVPIGNHFVSVSKQGHGFVDGGRFPKKAPTRYDFQTKVTGMNFFDTTTVTIVGRVAGGKPQTDKIPGFGLSKANIGKAKIRLKTFSSVYSLNLHEKDSTVVHKLGENGDEESRTTFKTYDIGSEIEIETNPVTGEFITVVPPVRYFVSYIATHDWEDTFVDGDERDFTLSKESFDINPFMADTLTYTYLSGVTSSLAVHDSLKITRYNQPVIDVKDLDAAEGAFGDKEYIYINHSNGNRDTISLYTIADGEEVVYKLGTPVFSQKTGQYAWKISAYEEYENKDGSPATPVIDHVPLDGQAITISNALASYRVDISDDNPDNPELSEESNSAMTLDSTGSMVYTFNVGFPNIIGDHKLRASLSLNKNEKIYSWGLDGIVFGQLPTDGSNFVTVGPDRVDVVLHDPPGSNSYAYLEKGSSIIKNNHSISEGRLSESFVTTIHIGPELRTGAGVGFIVMNETKSLFDINLGVHGEEHWVNSTERTTTTTFSQQVSTSSDPSYVGSDADVYIGRSYNQIFGMMRQLAIYPTADVPADISHTPVENGFSLFTKEVLTSGDEFATMFQYTQRYLIEQQIPEIRRLRNQLITTISSPSEMTNINFQILNEEKGEMEDVNVRYFSLLPASDPNFGEPEHYYVFFNDKALPQERIDEVAKYNSWIANWEQLIADNEKAKLDLFDKRDQFEAQYNPNVFENVSYDAGVTLEKSMEVNYDRMSMESWTVTLGGDAGIATGFGWNKVGLEIHADVSGDATWGKDNSEGASKSMKFGYVLSEDASVENGGGDALSVDVYAPSSLSMQKIVQGSGILLSDSIFETMNQYPSQAYFDSVYLNRFGKVIPNLSGYTFRTRAGQTSCPYESADSTLYYKNDNGDPVILNYGTIRIENPGLLINNQTYVPAVDNIPSGREATFELTLQNISDANRDVTYQLYVDEASNPDGLKISIDGQSLTYPRQVSVGARSEVTKTMKVSQTSTDILDYNNIVLRFGSVCEDDNYAEATFDVKFIASSSPVKLTANTTYANKDRLTNSEGKITFTISEYERNYRNFAFIRLEYRNVNDESWITVHRFINDPETYPPGSNDTEITSGESMAYDYYYRELEPTDGEYIFRAVTVSKAGLSGPEVTFSSEEIHIIKDVREPQVFGNPSPADGILDAGDEISISYNENIRSELLTTGNFKIRGLLNAETLAAPTSGVGFDGAQTAFVEMPIYANGSFSIEGWFKRTPDTEGVLFAYGEGRDCISLGFDAAGHAVVAVGAETKTSAASIGNSESWKYAGIAYDRNSGNVSVYVFYDAVNAVLFNKEQFTAVPATQGKFYAGNNADRNSGFHGAASRIHFYDLARSQANMSASMHLSKSGSEPNLIGFWTLDEGEGSTGKDKARSRHLNLNNADWYIYPQGKSLSLNGEGQYARISGTYLAFDRYDDFTIEFWFRGATQGAATLLSCGASAYIGFDSDHNLILSTATNTQILSSAGLLDDKWHQFALTVKRTGSTKAVIDGQVTAAFTSSSILDKAVGGFYYTGAKYKYDPAVPGTGSVFTEHFKGNIDELRVWESALTTEAILFNKNFGLRGDETGLLAYYPFERTEQLMGSIYEVNPSFKNVITEGNESAELLGGAVAGDESAPLQLARPVKDVPFTFTASNDKIVLNLTEEASLIEGVTLYISAEKIRDLSNNVSSPATWIAYVNRNALNWNADLVDEVMEEGETRSFKVSISNIGGEKADYFIEDLPSWLSVDAPQGNLNPLASKELTFTIARGINIGGYETAITLRGANDVKKILPVRLKVTGERPDWSVNPADYEQSMTIAGQLRIEGLPQEDSHDLLAAFINDSCAGLVSPKYEAAYQSYFVYLQVWGNTSDEGKDITFKIWDASTGVIYPSVNVSLSGTPLSLSYAGNGIKGSPDVPVVFDAREYVEQSIKVNTGWNWVSFNLVSASLQDANSLMRKVNNGVEIKGQAANAFSRYNVNSNYWTNGTLNGRGINPVNMYMVLMSGNNTILVPGLPLNPDTTNIRLVQGWNWIAYIPQVNQTVTEAFSGANPAVGDLVKSQTDFSIFSSQSGWVGTLDYLRPGIGYMYQTTTSRSFKYPRGGGVLTRSSGSDGVAFIPEAPASINAGIAPNYESNLSFIGTVRISSDNLSPSARLIAKAGSECRGVAEITKVGDKQLFFLPVFSNSTGVETITFVLENNGREIPLKETIRFKRDAIVGALEAPVQLSEMDIRLKAYPNPFIDKINVSFEIDDPKADVRIELISMTGAVIYSTVHRITTAGYQEMSITGAAVNNLVEGTYIIRVTVNNSETFTNIVIKERY